MEQDEIDEIRYENGLLKKRSEQYRLRCIEADKKCVYLERLIKKQDAKHKKRDQNNANTIQDLYAQLNGAVEVITTLKGLLETSQKDRARLLEEHNERLSEIHTLKETLFKTGMFYDRCLMDLKKCTEENERLRFVNIKLVEALRQKDKD